MEKSQRTDTLIICLADTRIKTTSTMITHPSMHDERVPGLPTDNQTLHANHTSNDTIKSYNHSNQKLDQIQKMTDLDKYRITKENQLNQYEIEKRPSTATGHDRCELHKKDDLYGNESINRRRVEGDVYGAARRATNLKFKYVRDGRDEPIGRTMVRIRAIAVVGLFLAMLATCAAAPVRSRRSHHERSMRNYLETFGYLKKDRPEVGNLLMGDEAQNYEDDFRIAIKTLQEFGGIPVTGEIDETTLELMKKKRCGRPDREDDEAENGHRRKRFALQGAKWPHTNLTWSLSQDRKPSQLDPYATREVLRRALDVWAQASRLTFKEINSDKADIVVSFARRFHDDGYPFDGRGSILAHAFFPGTGRGGDAHFDDEELWLLQPNNDNDDGTSLFAVAAHEFGHSLGLSHSSVKGALMFPWYQGIQQNFVLPQDDRNGIQQMYGPKENIKWGRIPNYRPIEVPSTTTSTTTTTTTTRRWHHHHNKKPIYHPAYTPQHPRDPSKYPSYTPQKPHYPKIHNYPEYPSHHNPTHHHYNTTVDYGGRTKHNYPRFTTTTTTTSTTPTPYTYRPRYPTPRPDYPYKPNNPVEPNKPYYPKKTTPRTTPAAPTDIPDECDTNYDAISLIRNELYIFKGKYHWRIGAHGRYKEYPIEIRRMWRDLPANLTHVDAVYERLDQKIVIFVGKQVYLFNLQNLVYGYPKPLTSLGLPETLEKVDAAMVWGHNSKTYFYSGSMYWKFDEDEGHVELDYPRNMAMWKGVGYNIDSVFQWKDGKTYFFKGKGFWRFNDLQMRVDQEMQLPSAQFWMGCPNVQGGTRSPYRALPSPGSTLRSLSHGTTININSILLCLASTILILRNYCRYYF